MADRDRSQPATLSVTRIAIVKPTLRRTRHRRRISDLSIAHRPDGAAAHHPVSSPPIRARGPVRQPLKAAHAPPIAGHRQDAGYLTTAGWPPARPAPRTRSRARVMRSRHDFADG